MLPEQRATSYAHDPALGTVLVHVADESRPSLNGDVPARLLLDAASHLVGIDIAPDSQDRLVVIENQRIVEWTRVDSASALRKHVRSTFKRLRKAGWHPQATSPIADASEAGRPTAAVRPVRLRERRLLRIAEQVLS